MGDLEFGEFHIGEKEIEFLYKVCADEEIENTNLDELTIDISSDPLDRISPRENSVLQQLKAHPCTRGMNDRELMIFLFARKLNLTRTIELINNYNKFLQEHGYKDRIVHHSDLNRELFDDEHRHRFVANRTHSQYEKFHSYSFS